MTNYTSVPIEDHWEKPLSLMGKWKKHYREGSPHGSHAKTSMRALFVFQAVTQLYVTLNYLVPFIFANFDPWTQYFLKVLVMYMCIVTCANWLCTICFTSKYVASRDRPDLDTRYSGETPAEHFGANKSLSQPYPSERTDPTAVANGHYLLEVSEKGGLPWHYCSRCQMFVPPRTSHCKFCNECVLRRDHHCHMIGVCIGHCNQRYFVVLAGYCIVVGYIGAYMTLSWLGHHHDSQSSLWIYFLPYTFYLVLTGSMDVTTGLLIFHAYMLCFIAPVSNMYFLSQLTLIAQGKTLREAVKKEKVKVTLPYKRRFELVFGDYWGVNFLFPAVIIFKQSNSGLNYDGIKIG